MVLGLTGVEGGIIIGVIIAVGVAARYYRHGGIINVDTAAGDVHASSNGDDDHYVDLSASGEGDVSGALGSGASEQEDTTLDDVFVQEDLTVIAGVGEATEAKLKAAGFEVVEQVADASIEALAEVEGIGEARAKDLQQAAATALEDDSGNGS